MENVLACYAFMHFPQCRADTCAVQGAHTHTHTRLVNQRQFSFS